MFLMLGTVRTYHQMALNFKVSDQSASGKKEFPHSHPEYCKIELELNIQYYNKVRVKHFIIEFVWANSLYISNL